MKKPKITANEVFDRLVNTHIANLFGSRGDYMRGSLDLISGRDLDKECGYPPNDPTIDDYKKTYERLGLGQRVVNVYSEESWAIHPELFQKVGDVTTAFDRRVKTVWDNHCIWSTLSKADEVSGIGHYGGVLIGVNDNRRLSDPAFQLDKEGKKIPEKGKNSQKERDILFLRPFSEDLVRVDSVETNEYSPRFGQPLMYDITLSDPGEGSPSSSTAVTSNQKVHWSRFLHVADGTSSCPWKGKPRQKLVYNDLLDVRKMGGSFPEMWYKGAWPGIAFEALPELTANATLDKASLKKEIDEYANGVKRYMQLLGMKANVLSPNIADPTNPMLTKIQLICAALGVPIRIFMGSEAGHLASTQDSVTWNRRLKKRQNEYITPFIIRPFVQRLMWMGVLPEVESFVVEWGDLNAISDTDRAKVGLQQTQSLLQYVTSGAYEFILPKLFLVYFMGFSDADAEAMVKERGGNEAVIGALKKVMESQNASATAGNTPASSNKSSASKTGAGGRRNAQGGKTRKKKNV